MIDIYGTYLLVLCSSFGADCFNDFINVLINDDDNDDDDGSDDDDDYNNNNEDDIHDSSDDDDGNLDSDER